MVKASASGKVLIIGGYLVVEAPNLGVSIGTTARFESRIVSWKDVVKGSCRVHIISPQFGQKFTFECSVTDGSEQNVCATQTEGVNSPFLYYSVLYAVAAAFSQGCDVFRELTLELLADNDFYSQRNYLEGQNKKVSVENLRALPKNLPLVGAVSKTGLGSSAAMTTSAVACLYNFFCESRNESRAGAGAVSRLELVHRIAQIAHSVAQGKIGSGFDVYTATYGTCVYRRFPAEFVKMIMDGTEAPRSVGISSLMDRCVMLQKNEWVKREEFRLPPELRLMLGDVHQGGSGTPGMVSKVMAWRKSVADCTESLWEQLCRGNEKYVEAFYALTRQARERTLDYTKAVNVLKKAVLGKHTPGSDAERLWLEAANCACVVRRLLREMGQAAGVDIEPRELTTLLDATCALPGVFAVGCPGAGGYDAVFALVIGDETCAVVEKFWEDYSALNVCPLLVREDAGGLVAVLE